VVDGNSQRVVPPSAFWMLISTSISNLDLCITVTYILYTEQTRQRLYRSRYRLYPHSETDCTPHVTDYYRATDGIWPHPLPWNLRSHARVMLDGPVDER
jgi:hypothetical protein